MNAIFAKQLGCLFFLLLIKLYTVVRTLFAFQTDDNFVLKIIKIIVNLLRQIGLEGHYDFNFVQIYVRLLPPVLDVICNDYAYLYLYTLFIFIM